MRRFFKRVYFSATRSLLDSAARRVNAGFALTYHRFEARAGADPLPGMAVTVETFRRQIQILRQVGPFVRVDDLISTHTSPSPRFCLTFDDGYRDNAALLPALLDELQVPCCIYVTAGFVAGAFKRLPHDEALGFDAPAMTASQLRTLSRHPLVTIGCHSFRHPRFNAFEPRLWREETVVAKKWIEEVIGREVRHFAFPYGQESDVAWPYVSAHFADAGFTSIASNFGGSNANPNQDRFPSQRPRLWHIKRAPAITSEDPLILTSWALGMANLEDIRRPRRFLDIAP
jgi:peptidoglycan/xylan/chitin deacetylase (PgdA/CDA1 family)